MIAADGRTTHSHVIHVIDLLRRENVTKFAINVDPEDVAHPDRTQRNATTRGRGSRHEKRERQRVVGSASCVREPGRARGRVRRARARQAGAATGAPRQAEARDGGDDRRAAQSRRRRRRAAQGGARGPKPRARAWRGPRPKATAATPPPRAAPPPAAETPADFTGQTLTNDGPGEGWASRDRQRRDDERPGRPARARRSPGASSTGMPDGDRRRAARRGARRICRTPPARARSRGRARGGLPARRRARKGSTGKAVVKARIMPDGHVRDLALVSQSGARLRRRLPSDAARLGVDAAARPRRARRVDVHQLHLPASMSSDAVPERCRAEPTPMLRDARRRGRSTGPAWSRRRRSPALTLDVRARRVRRRHGAVGLGQDDVPEHRRPARRRSTRRVPARRRRRARARPTSSCRACATRRSASSSRAST